MSKPARNPWQLHLSTAVLLMFVAATLLLIEMTDNPLKAAIGAAIFSIIAAVEKADAVTPADGSWLGIGIFWGAVDVIFFIAVGSVCERSIRRREAAQE